jgi:hypothetical protein
MGGNAEIYLSFCVNVQRFYHSSPGDQAILCVFNERTLISSDLSRKKYLQLTLGAPICDKMQGTFPESSSYFKAAFGIYIVRNIENCL